MGRRGRFISLGILGGLTGGLNQIAQNRQRRDEMAMKYADLAQRRDMEERRFGLEQERLGMERDRAQREESSRFVPLEFLRPGMGDEAYERWAASMGPEARIPTSSLPSILSSTGQQQALAETRRKDEAAKAEARARMEGLQGVLGTRLYREPAEGEYGPVAPEPGLKSLYDALPFLDPAKGQEAALRQIAPPERKPLVLNEGARAFDERGTPIAENPKPAPERKPIILPEGARAFDQTGAPFAENPKPMPEKPERTFSGRLAETELRYKQNPTDPKAKADYEQARLAYQNEMQLAGGRESERVRAQTAGRPLDATERTAIDNYNDVISSAQLFRDFTPEEITAYTGLLQRGGKDVGQFLTGLPVVGGAFGKPDERFAQFKALMGRFEGTAFGEGGKQLTGIEKRVVMQYTPNGKELGGAPEMQAKLKNLEAFTRIARRLRIELARTGKGEIDPDQLDAMLLSEMRKAGLPIPGEGQAPSGTPTGGAGPIIKSIRRVN